MMKKKHLKIAIALFIITGVVFAAWQMGLFNAPIFPIPGASYSGDMDFTAVPLFSDYDSTDIDGAGSLKVYSQAGEGWVHKETLTMGTDTTTATVFRSGETWGFSLESTTTNALDHFTYIITFPYADYAEGPKVQGVPLYVLNYDHGDGDWVIEFRSAQEATIVLQGIDAVDGEVFAAAGTDTFTFSSSINYFTCQIWIPVETDDDALVWFYDFAEGEYDKLFLEADLNCTAANSGLEIISSGWVQQDNSPDYVLDLSPYIANGMLVKCSEENEFGAVVIEVTFYCGGDLDLSGTGDVIVTFNLEECSSLEDALKDNWDSDSVTNFAGADTAEQLEFTDG